MYNQIQGASPWTTKTPSHMYDRIEHRTELASGTPTCQTCALLYCDSSTAGVGWQYSQKRVGGTALCTRQYSY